MQLDHDAFSPDTSSHAIRRLGHADSRDVNSLYALEGDGFWYSGNHIDQGIYFGAFVRGQLVAAAGTHTYSESEGVGVVGNVFTHPDFRNRGLGTAVTSTVTEFLRPRCSLIVLNVDPANRGARRVYERLGYSDTGRILEAMATRRDPYSPMPMVNRLLARWRSDIPDTEIVPA